jgi:hypothetical protein
MDDGDAAADGSADLVVVVVGVVGAGAGAEDVLAEEEQAAHAATATHTRARASDMRPLTGLAEQLGDRNWCEVTLLHRAIRSFRNRSRGPWPYRRDAFRTRHKATTFSALSAGSP